jgi:hypothetical protein
VGGISFSAKSRINGRREKPANFPLLATQKVAFAAMDRMMMGASALAR